MDIRYRIKQTLESVLKKNYGYYEPIAHMPNTFIGRLSDGNTDMIIISWQDCTITYAMNKNTASDCERLGIDLTDALVDALYEQFKMAVANRAFNLEAVAPMGWKITLLEDGGDAYGVHIQSDGKTITLFERIDTGYDRYNLQNSSKDAFISSIPWEYGE
jgi:hypothetical protein